MRPATRGDEVTALVVEELSWRIGGVAIVDNVSLYAEPGEFLGVIGPNGAGKTSLFQMLSGLRAPTQGRVMLHGTDVTKLRPFERARLGLGRTFQSSSVFGTLSVRDNVELAASSPAPGLFRRSKTRVALSALETVGLGEKALVPAGVLSHGDKRKLEIALILVTSPSVVLLDEPLAGVAAGDIPDLLKLIGTLTGDGRTVLMVEHHIEAILSLADRIAVLHHGALLACDTPAGVMASAVVQEAYLGEEL